MFGSHQQEIEGEPFSLRDLHERVVELLQSDDPRDRYVVQVASDAMRRALDAEHRADALASVVSSALSQATAQHECTRN